MARRRITEQDLVRFNQSVADARRLIQFLFNYVFATEIEERHDKNRLVIRCRACGASAILGNNLAMGYGGRSLVHKGQCFLEYFFPIADELGEVHMALADLDVSGWPVYINDPSVPEKPGPFDIEPEAQDAET